MANRSGETDKTYWRRLMVRAAVEGAKNAGYTMERQPGRGLSNIWEASKGGKTTIASIRTTRDRWIAFPPLNNGTRWKTLDDVDFVLVSAVDNPENPRHVDVYLFPAKVVRQRFDANYKARIKTQSVPDNFGMWVRLDAAESNTSCLDVGAGLAVKYPAIARFSLGELETETPVPAQRSVAEAAIENDEIGAAPVFATVGDVLAWARSEIARLSGMSSDAIRLDLKIEA